MSTEIIQDISTIMKKNEEETTLDKAIWKFSNPGGNYNDHVKMKKDTHIISVYQGTNCGWYLGVQCQTEGCPGRGWTETGCPYIDYLGSFNEDALEDILEEFVDLGFEPIV
jgi:hypothetical protein